MGPEILITGASGTIGRALLNLVIKEKLDDKVGLIVNNKWPITIYQDNRVLQFKFLEADLTKKQHVQSIFSYWPGIKKIIHLAANASPRSSEIDSFYDLNLRATHYLLEYAPKPVDFIFASSILYYGDDGSFYETDSPNPSNLYGVTKVASEHLINIFYRKSEVRPRILRLCGNVGPKLNHGRLHEALYPEMIPKPMQLRGKAPGNMSPLCHVNETAQAIMLALNYNKPKLTCNICPADYISLEDMLKTANPDIELEWDNNGNSSAINIYNDKAWIELGWRPTLNSKQALEKALKEIKNAL